MPDLVANTTDSYCNCVPQGTFETARDHAGSSAGDPTRTKDNYTMGSLYFSRRGFYIMYRSYYVFNCGGISVAPASATLKIAGFQQSSANVIAVKSAADIELHSSDYRDGLADISSAVDTALTNSAGDGSGSFASLGIAYMDSPTSSWSTTSYNEMAFNATALADMASLIAFKVCVMEYDHDFLDVENTTGVLVNGSYWADEGLAKMPTLSYTEATTDNATFFGANF